MKKSFFISLFIFPIVLIFGLFFGNLHGWLGGYFSVIGLVVNIPFIIMSDLFNHSNSIGFWISGGVLQFSIIFLIVFTSKKIASRPAKNRP